MYLKIIEQIAKSHPETTLVVEELEVGESIFRKLLIEEEEDRERYTCSIRFEVNSNGIIFDRGISGICNWYFTPNGRLYCKYAPVNISKKIP